jgi:hypothetical protein
MDVIHRLKVSITTIISAENYLQLEVLYKGTIVAQ